MGFMVRAGNGICVHYRRTLLLQLVQITDLKVIINDNFKDSESFEKYVKDLYKYYESYIGQYNQYKSLEYIFSN